MKRTVIFIALLILTTANFGRSTELRNANNGKSDTGNPKQLDSNNRQKRMSSFPQVEQEDDTFSSESLADNMDDAVNTGMDSSFVATEGSPCYYIPSGTSDPTDFLQSIFPRIGRSPSSFVRIGKSRLAQDGKRASSFVRIGRSLDQMSGPTGSSLNRPKRQSQFVRFGRDPSIFSGFGIPLCDVETGKGPNSFTRYARSPSNFVRIGKSEFSNYGKRGNSFVRIGKNSEPDMSDYSDLVKRMSSFVRIGKSDDAYSDLMKRASSFVRIGKSAEDDKRASRFVRIGKSDESDGREQSKRASSFLRIGKSGLASDEFSKRGSSFVRIGKSPSLDSSFPYSLDDPLSASLEDDEPIRVASRGSSFVRIGKIPSSSFVRIGKKRDLTMDPVEYSRWVSG